MKKFNKIFLLLPIVFGYAYLKARPKIKKKLNPNEARDYLIVVDMQNDFINGSLGTPSAVAITSNVIDKVNKFDGEVWFTQDTHNNTYLRTQEGKKLPVVHCIEGTEGWKLHPQLDKFRKANDCLTFKKNSFGCHDMAKKILAKHKCGKVKSVTLIGLCTDICVLSNALLIKSMLPEVPISVDSQCCAGADRQKHAEALNMMKSCQINVI